MGRIVWDPVAAAREFHLRTGIFPMLHVMGVRRTLLQAHPGLADDLVAAFARARDLAFSAGSHGGMPQWQLEAHSYGMGEGDRKSLEAFLGYHFRQGLSARQLGIADLFAL